MVRLYIEDSEIELDKTVLFAITKLFEELSDPTVIINDWSKTVSIPFTNKNHNTFGHIYNPDKVIVDTPVSNYTGIYFDPLKKLKFRLEYDNAILMTGYAKMNEIKQSKGTGSYEVSLFGTLGKVLQEMSKITFDQNSPDTDYIIDGEKYVSETYNKELIYNSWTSSGQILSQLYPRKLKLPNGTIINHPAYHLTDIIGFAPNNSFDNGFDYKSYQSKDTSNNTIAKKFTTSLETAQFQEATGISPDNAIPNGMLPREIGEYRSYLQLPFIYWNKLFQIFKEKTEEITGYSVVLDEYWFNDDNPYWHDLVYMLQRKKFDDKSDESEDVNTYIPRGVNYTYKQKWDEHGDPYYIMVEVPDNNNYNNIFNSQIKTGRYNNNWFPLSDKYTTTLKFPKDEVSESEELLIDTSTFYFSEKFSSSDIVCEINLPISIIYEFSAMLFLFIPLSCGDLGGDNALNLNIVFKDESNTVLKTIRTLIVCDDYSSLIGLSDYDIIIHFENIAYSTEKMTGPNYMGGINWPYSINDFNITYNTNLNNLIGKKVHIDVEALWKNDNYPAETKHANGVDFFNIMLRNDKNRYIKFRMSSKNRSNAYFTLNDLWNNDVKIFNEIIRYCKMFRISINVDDKNKTISFVPFNKVFENYTITDWTNKVDKSKDFIIKPITLEDKYIVFNNEGNKTYLSDQYKEDVGLEYGSYRLITDYEFNNNTKNLFSGCKESITNTDAVLSWTNLHINKRLIYSLPAEIYVYNKDKDNKFVSSFGSFFFHKGLKNFDTDPSLALRSVIITDDTDYMKFNKTYFYEQYSSSDTYKRVTTYPFLDVIYNNNLCLFGAPKKSYTYNSEYSYKNGIYENLWADYINERYNIQNKLLTCYLMIGPSDFVNFKWNQFIKISNQIYVINKIYNYDILGSQSTKVDLIKVQDINAYTNAGFKYDYIRSSVSALAVPYDHFRKITIDATRNWEIEANDYSDFLTVTPTEGGPGTTTVYIGANDETNGYTLTFNLLDDLYNTIKTTDVQVTVGGTTSLEATPFLTQLNAGESGTFSVNSSTGWHLDWVDEKGNNDIQISPTIWNSSGQKTVNITTSDFGNGMYDFYIENEAGDIVSKRVYVPEPYVSFSDPAIQLEQGQSKTITVYNRALSPWQIESYSGNASVTLNPTTGPAASVSGSSETQMTITAGNTTGTNIYIFGVTSTPGENISKLMVNVIEPE